MGKKINYFRNIKLEFFFKIMLPSITRTLFGSLSNQCKRKLSATSAANVRAGRQTAQPLSSALPNIQEVQTDTDEVDIAKTKEILSKVDEQILKKDYGRLFAVLMIDKHQHKLTDGDLLMVLRDLGASLGQRIRLEKVLLVGSKDFTLIGRPFLPRDQISVEATVVEKTLTHKKVNHWRNINHRQRKTQWIRDTSTTLRINKIELLQPVDETSDRLGFEKPNNKYGF